MKSENPNKQNFLRIVRAARKSPTLPVWIYSILGILVFTVTSSRRIAYYDFNYLQNAVYRISLGEIPFRDFDLVLPAVPFLIVYLVHFALQIPLSIATYISTCLLIFTTTHSLIGITNKLIGTEEKSKLKKSITSVLVFSSLFGVVSIYPNYVYDSVATAFALAAINQFLAYLRERERKLLVFTGIYLALSIFSKYNMGGFLAIGFAVTLAVIHYRESRNKIEFLLRALVMLLLPTTLFGVVFLLTGPFAVYNQTILAASKFKNLNHSDHLAQYNYPALIVIMLSICVVIFKRQYSNILSYACQGYIFLGLVIVAVQQLTNSESLKSKTLDIFSSASFLFPILMLVALHKLITNWKELPLNQLCILLSVPIYFFGTFLSQGWNGSSYSLWPMLAILSLVIFSMSNDLDTRMIGYFRVFSIGLLVIGLGISSFKGERLGFVEQNGKRHEMDFNFNVIGTAISEKDLNAISEVKQQINMGEYFGKTIILPAEDSIVSFGSTQKPWGRCLQYTAICPSFSESVFLNEFVSDPPNVVIIKKDPQILFDIEPITAIVLSIGERCFTDKYSNDTYRLFVHNESTLMCLASLETK